MLNGLFWLTSRLAADRPLVLLADEPTGNLDSRATGDILRLFAELGQAGQALVSVTHDARVASTADRLRHNALGLAEEDAAAFTAVVTELLRREQQARAEAEALVQKAHQVCPYSNATRGNIDVTLNVAV